MERNGTFQSGRPNAGEFVTQKERLTSPFPGVAPTSVTSAGARIVSVPVTYSMV